jgi:hypothetical protein
MEAIEATGPREKLSPRGHKASGASLSSPLGGGQGGVSLPTTMGQGP